ncbi:hypothetical protein Drose_21285 [Dactylosporangium roseum]|uniref:Uncharacterized protein n=1 Tax=Dactylosporangium roseum TaxID=47989 RepID=A0ABY5YY68_9ACTN|nr:hypothetical protein [Dactylosporangium roseum]UWZ33808.1 hypothetical protein Drose_21285 [Dactylosporangium roseum]
MSDDKHFSGIAVAGHRTRRVPAWPRRRAPPGDGWPGVPTRIDEEVPGELIRAGFRARNDTA